jgi:endonuclease III-like uncharacterized protein
MAKVFNQEEKSVEELRNKVLEALKKNEDEYQEWSVLIKIATK